MKDYNNKKRGKFLDGSYIDSSYYQMMYVQQGRSGHFRDSMAYSRLHDNIMQTQKEMARRLIPVETEDSEKGKEDVEEDIADKEE